MIRLMAMMGKQKLWLWFMLVMHWWYAAVCHDGRHECMANAGLQGVLVQCLTCMNTLDACIAPTSLLQDLADEQWFATMCGV